MLALKQAVSMRSKAYSHMDEQYGEHWTFLSLRPHHNVVQVLLPLSHQAANDLFSIL